MVISQKTCHTIPGSSYLLVPAASAAANTQKIIEIRSGPVENQTNNESFNNSSNWHLTFYYGKNDTRVFVPKRRGYGMTLNFARPLTYAWLGLLLLPPFLVLAVVLATKM
jgi:uncharacterized membrane protein